MWLLTTREEKRLVSHIKNANQYSSVDKLVLNMLAARSHFNKGSSGHAHAKMSDNAKSALVKGLMYSRYIYDIMQQRCTVHVGIKPTTQVTARNQNIINSIDHFTYSVTDM